MTDLNLAAYPHMGIANPVSDDAVGAMLDRTDLTPGDRVAELGCGNAALAVLMARRGLDVLAVDRGEAMADIARQRVAAADLGDRVQVRTGEAAAVADAQGPFRLVAALGTTQLGDFGRLGGWIVPGGWLLWGDLFWVEAPATPPPGMDYDTDAGWRRRGAGAGLELVSARVSSEAEWEAYVAALTAGVRSWAVANREHPRRAAIEARAAALAMLYGPASRTTLGFGLYLFRKPI